jgi:hypothetical protein
LSENDVLIESENRTIANAALVGQNCRSALIKSFHVRSNEFKEFMAFEPGFGNILAVATAPLESSAARTQYTCGAT